jgi:cysteine desulfurase
MGLPAAEAHASVRFSLGEGNDEADIDWILEATPAAIARLRAMNDPGVRRSA